MTDEIKRDPETGFPRKDGYVKLIYADPLGEEEIFPYEECTTSVDLSGFMINDVDAQWQRVIPLHRVHEIRNVNNSPEYRQAVEYFQLNCDHNYVHQDHHILTPCSGNKCTKCNLQAPIAEEDIHAQQE